MEQLVQVNKYLLETYLFSHSSEILKFNLLQDTKNQNNNQILRILLKENIFHPQGGGQPNDIGYINFNEETYQIHSIYHDKIQNYVYLDILERANLLNSQLSLEPNNFMIQQFIDSEKRKYYARLHSAGHLLDIAVNKLGYNWIPGKGYHFPDGPYVEYIGSINGLNTDQIRDSLAITIKQIINETDQTDMKIVSYLTPSQYLQKSGKLPDFLLQVESIRYVELCKSDRGCPCGGTHVDHIKEIQGVQISKIQKKGKNIRVSYALDQLESSQKK